MKCKILPRLRYVCALRWNLRQTSKQNILTCNQQQVLLKRKEKVSEGGTAFCVRICRFQLRFPQKQTLRRGSGNKNFIWKEIPGSPLSELGKDIKLIKDVSLSRFPCWQLRPIPLGTSGRLCNTIGEGKRGARGTRRRKSRKGRRWTEEEKEEGDPLATQAHPP